MLQRWIGELKKTPARLSERGTAIGQAARARVLDARDDGEQRLWALRTQTLEQVGDALGKAPEVPVVTTLADAAERLVTRRLDALTAVPIEGYADLNAREAIKAIKDLERKVALTSVRRHEERNKNRKTVLRAIEERISAVTRTPAAPTPEPEPTPEPVPA